MRGEPSSFPPASTEIHASCIRTNDTDDIAWGRGAARHALHVTRYTSHVTHHTPTPAPSPSPIVKCCGVCAFHPYRHTTLYPRLGVFGKTVFPGFLPEYSWSWQVVHTSYTHSMQLNMRVTCHTSQDTRQTSHVTHHTSHVTRHPSPAAAASASTFA